MLSSRARYAVRAILDLSVREDQGPIQSTDIAARQLIPIDFLQQILGDLKSAHLVETRRGPMGGYFLARRAKEITLGEVIRLMDGPIAPISCVSVTQFAECGCPEPDSCPLRRTFKQVRDSMSSVFDNVSFAELASRQGQMAIQGSANL